jgi:hypothetical protein
VHSAIDAGTGLADDVVDKAVGERLFDVGVEFDFDGDVCLRLGSSLLIAG